MDEMMDQNIFDKVKHVDLKKTMETSYIDYAMSVIASRALPDVRDGLKPVQRRVLYSMIELNNGPDKPHRKSARIVGDTMGKYHPHGDSSIYGALVNMAQEWSTRYPLVDGHGNFGSVDGDGAAAMRYTEARLSKISMELLADINKDTVDFVPNFDETEKEPSVLPSRYPNLLVNGTTGIAVGMATNIPPHNLREVVDGVIKIIDNKVDEDRDTDIEEILPIIKAPDFPTGAVILGTKGCEEAYRTGRGKIRVRAVSNIETMPNGKNRIVVTELPYMVNKANLIIKIAEKLKEYDAKNIVVDPVMVATSGARLISEDAVSTLKEYLFPLAQILTPNIPEAEVLSGMTITSEAEMMEAAKVIGDQYGCAVLLKGGHKVNDANDLLYHKGTCQWFYGKRIDNPNTHGTGCTLSSAIASNLAKGFPMDVSVERAKAYISGALAAMLDLGKGSGPMNHGFAITGEYAKEIQDHE